VRTANKHCEHPSDIPTAETIIDKAIVLHAIGGVYERQTPTPFICLLLRLLQLQPEKEILFEYLLAEEFK
jgi:pre-mRNA-splicing factor 38A